MKKNFFKKLSFVMALAMIVSVIAPAAGAFAAAAPKLSSTSKYLHLGDAETGKYDFNISNKKTGWTFKWKSANTKVVTVNQAGVATAKGIGSTDVSVTIYDKDGEVYDTLTADVTVRDNVAKDGLSVYVQSPADADLTKLAVGKAYDFGRYFTTESGATNKDGGKGKTSDITRWEVNATSDKAAVVEDTGVFTATVPGDYTITARSFQSAAKYTAWKADKTLDVVTATATVNVKVVPTIDSITQKSGNKFEVVFSANMKDVVTAANLKITDSNNINLPIVKSVAFDATGKIATVETYINLTDKETYTVSYNDISGKLVASQGAVDHIVLAGPLKVADNEPLAFDVKYYDKNNVEVSKADIASVSFAISNNVGWITSDNKIILFNVGDVAKVKATYKTGTYDANWNEIKFDSNELTVVCVDSIAATTVGMSAWTLSDKATGYVADDFKTVAQSLPLGTTKYIAVKGVDSDNKDVFSGNANFKFTSTDPTKLIVDETTGQVIPVQEGPVGVIVESGSYKTVITVTVSPVAKAATATPDVYQVNLSNAPAVAATQTFTLTVKDQYQKEVAADNKKVESLVRPTNVAEGTALGYMAILANDGNKAQFKFSASGATAGTYSYRLTSNGLAVVVSVTVKAPEADVVSYRFETSGLDLRINKDTNASTKGISIKLYSYDKNGVAIAPVNATNLKLTNGEGTVVASISGGAITGLTTSATGVYSVSGASVSGGAITKLLKTGNYTLTGDVAGTVIVPAYFAVSDTQPVPTVNQLKSEITISNAANLYTELAACFEAKTNNEATTTTFAILPANVQTTASVSGGAIATDGSYKVLVQKVTVTETLNGQTLATNVDVNKVITVIVK